MKLLFYCISIFVTLNEADILSHSSYGYLVKYGIPAAQRIRLAEEKHSRIVGGVPAATGQYPWQAGLITDIINDNRLALCGASLISASRLVTAAHCWKDGVSQGWRFTVVLGSTRLFSGGTRIQTSAVAVHPNWFPLLARNDVAVIYLPNPVILSNIIAPISLPTIDEMNDAFAGQSAIASGFGQIDQDVPVNQDQTLSHIRLKVITNNACSWTFPVILSAGHLCTSGVGNVGVCFGDSGGPLMVTRSGRDVLIGIASFVSQLGCQSGLPSVFTRVTTYMDFINKHLVQESL